MLDIKNVFAGLNLQPFPVSNIAIVPYPQALMISYLKNFTLRQACGWLALVCVAMLAFGMFLQHVVGLGPCPMCIVQRYALILVAACAGLAWLAGRNSSYAGTQARSTQVFAALAGLFAVAGAFVAARQSWLQWYPPQEVSCGRDFYGMIETFPLKRAFPMIFKGGGDCSKVDWTFLGGSIANWSFVGFLVIALVLVILVLRKRKAAL